MTDQVDVLIVGAGPAGLAAAIELGLRGIRTLVVEQNPRSGMAPRAKTTNVRTRTHLRRWGIADRLAEQSPFGVDYPANMVFVTSLAGFPLALFENASNTRPERSPLYPEHGQWIPQYTLERVLVERVRTLDSVSLRYDTSFVTATQNDSQVTAQLQNSDGKEYEVTAHYLIGADGARSMVRDLIGAKMEGRYGLSRNSNIIFRAPGLATAHSQGPGAVYWQLGKYGFSAVGPMDKGDIWFFAPTGLKEGQTLSDDEAIALIKERTGIDLPYEILSADVWVASELLADRYADRRILLAGDAAHLHPPFGGYGMNMGVGDGVDLGWKIAATLQGWGGPRLVESYVAERRRVHRLVIDEAVANHSFVVAEIPPEIEDKTSQGEAIRAKVGAGIQATKAREFHTLGTVLGLGYENSPILADEGGPPPHHDATIYTPTARPGYLAPHAWLPDGRSLYDLFGLEMSLLAGSEADPLEIKKAQEDAAELGVPLKVVQPQGIDVFSLYGAQLTLIRPDQHVAWRGNCWTNPLPLATGREVSAE